MMNYLSEASVLGKIKQAKDSALLGYMTVKGKNKGKVRDVDRAPYLGGSISNYAKDLIMTFPVLCDNTLSPETASMISRANERYVITMIQLLFASEQINGNGGKEVLKKIHTNLKTSMGIDDYINACDTIYTKISGNKPLFEAREITKATNDMVTALKTQVPTRYPENNFSTKSLNDYKVINFNGRYVVKEADKDMSGMPDMTSYSTFDTVSKEYDPDTMDAMNKRAQIHATQRDQYRKDMDAIRRDREVAAAQLQSQRDMFSKMLVDSDVKKANELAPSLIILNFVPVDDTGAEKDEVKSFIAGVKSRLVPVDGMDIVERIAAKNRTKLSFLNLIRATTGEIRFLRDFILCVDQAKINAKNAAKKGMAAKMWDTLEFRASKNGMKKLKKAGNDASAITTLVINQETVNFIRKEHEFDIESPKNAKMIMDAYNLMGIIICDEATETAKIMYAGNDSFEQQAYSYLEKESNDKSYKKVVNLIGQMNGR